MGFETTRSLLHVVLSSGGGSGCWSWQVQGGWPGGRGWGAGRQWRAALPLPVPLQPGTPPSHHHHRGHHWVESQFQGCLPCELAWETQGPSPSALWSLLLHCHPGGRCPHRLARWSEPSANGAVPTAGIRNLCHFLRRAGWESGLGLVLVVDYVLFCFLSFANLQQYLWPCSH